MEFEHKTLFIDIETTGLVPQITVEGKRKGTTKKQQLPYETEYMNYPYIVSMAWKINNGETTEYVLNQEGREIPEEASDIHKITTEITDKSEFTFNHAILEMLNGEITCFDTEIVVGHGLYFDTSILKANILREIDLKRENLPLTGKDFEYMTEILHKDKRIDTMRSTAKMMRGWATLSALHMKIFRKGFDAHTARNDVEAVSRCYGWLVKKGIVPTWEELQEKKNV